MKKKVRRCPLRTAAGPRPAAGGHSRHRRIHRRILPRDLRRLPVEMVRRAAARAGRHHGPPPVPQAPLHAGPHTAEGRGFRPPAGGAVPASRVGTAPLRHGLLRRTHAPRIPDPFVGRTALRRLRQRGGAYQQHQRSGRAHGDLLLRPQPPQHPPDPGGRRTRPEGMTRRPAAPEATRRPPPIPVSVRPSGTPSGKCPCTA